MHRTTRIITHFITAKHVQCTRFINYTRHFYSYTNTLQQLLRKIQELETHTKTVIHGT